MKNIRKTATASVALVVVCLSTGGFTQFAYAKWYRCYFSACKKIENGIRPDQCREKDQEIITWFQNNLWPSNERDPHVLGKQQILNAAVEDGMLIQEDGHQTVIYYDRSTHTDKQAVVQNILCQWPWDDLPNVRETQLEGAVKLTAQSDCSGITELKQGESAKIYTFKLIPMINSALHELELTVFPSEGTAIIVTVDPMHLTFANNGQKTNLKAIYESVTNQDSDVKNIKIDCRQSSSYISNISVK